MKSFSLLAFLLSALGVLAVTDPVSTDGRCGGEQGQTCSGSAFGNSCSKYGWCGSTSVFTGDGCQPRYGECKNRILSPHGQCGLESGAGSREIICAGSSFGNCCSQWGFCGTGADFCGTGCQGSYSTCTDHRSSSNSAQEPLANQQQSGPSSPSSASASPRPSAASTLGRSLSATATPSPSFTTLIRAESASSTSTRPLSRVAIPSASSDTT